MGREAGYGATYPCDLSGEWADVPSGPEVYAAILDEADVEEPEGEEWFTEVLDEYEEAYEAARREGAEEFISQVRAKVHLSKLSPWAGSAWADLVEQYIRNFLEEEAC